MITFDKRKKMKKKFFLIVICFALIITSLAFCLTGCSNIVKISKKKPLDLTGMELVFEDNFDGDLNSDVWATTFDNPIRRGGYWTEEQTFTKDGSLIIRTEYKENGSQGAGWYTGTCLSQYKKEFTYGYFEAKCKAPAAEGLWSAFWMQAENMAQNLSTDGGKNGAEIDIMESPFYNDPAMTIKYRNTTLHTIHVDGYGDDHKATNSKYFEVNKDIYNEFNTYGVLWTENEYVFYINGYETWRTDFGVSQVPEFLWLSVEIAGESGSANPSNKDNQFTWAGEITNNPKDKAYDFVVDYVKVFQFAK